MLLIGWREQRRVWQFDPSCFFNSFRRNNLVHGPTHEKKRIHAAGQR